MSTLDGFSLEIVATYKYLGVCLDSSLSFHTHISKLQSKTKSRIGFLENLRKDGRNDNKRRKEGTKRRMENLRKDGRNANKRRKEGKEEWKT